MTIPTVVAPPDNASLPPSPDSYDLTPDGQRVAIFYTKVRDRLLRPLLAADQPPAPDGLRAALSTIDRHIHSYTEKARLRGAAQELGTEPKVMTTKGR